MAKSKQKFIVIDGFTKELPSSSEGVIFKFDNKDILIRFKTKIDNLSNAISDLSHVVDKNLNSKCDYKAA